MQGEWLTVPEVAKRLGISTTTVYGLLVRGELPETGWPLRVRRTHLKEYVERSRIRPGQLGRTRNQYAGRPEEGVAEWYQARRRQGRVTTPAAGAPTRRNPSVLLLRRASYSGATSSLLRLVSGVGGCHPSRLP